MYVKRSYLDKNKLEIIELKDENLYKNLLEMSSNMASTLEEEQSLRECENYIQTHSIQRVLKDCIVQLCVSRPENPISFLRQYFQKLERVSTYITMYLNYIKTFQI